MTEPGLTPTEYSILEEAKCGPEEFFVLVSSIDHDDRTELKAFASSLDRLVQDGLLAAWVGGLEVPGFGRAALDHYLERRLVAGEQLDEHPSVCQELSFATTAEGMKRLDEADRPEVGRGTGDSTAGAPNDAPEE